MTSTLVLVDAGMVAGYRRSSLSLAQLHQALVHLHRQHPEVRVAVVADPSMKWDLGAAEQKTFDGDIVAGAVVCAPAGAFDGTAGFMERAAQRARHEGHDVIAFTARAIPGVALGRLRNEDGRWLWDLEGTTTIDATEAKAATGNGGSRRRKGR
jgi:cystathionine beta-lyase family protein involved in aluminum resistance